MPGLPESFKIYHEEKLDPKMKIIFEAHYLELGESLDKLLHYAIRFFVDANTKLQSTPPCHNTFELMGFELIDIFDAISILTKSGSANSIIPLLRTAIEIQFGMDYLTLDMDKYYNKSLAYEYWHILNVLNYFQIRDKKHQKSKSAVGEFKNEKIPNLLYVQAEGVDNKAEQEKCQRDLEQPKFHEIHKYFSEHKNCSNWFGLLGGPNSIVALAQEIGFASFYSSIYAGLSNMAHGASAGNRFQQVDNVGYINPIRSPKWLPLIVKRTGTLIAMFSKMLYKRILPENNLINTEFDSQISDFDTMIKRYVDNRIFI